MDSFKIVKRKIFLIGLTILFALSCVKNEVPPPAPQPEPSPEPEQNEPGVYGYVTCNDKPLANVVVSDGFITTQTLSDGSYLLKTEKKNAFVFIEVPSGFKVENNGIQPLFYKQLNDKESEQVDFQLIEQPNQDNHLILFIGDLHLANSSSTNDLKQVNAFTTEISSFVSEHPNDVIYAITLGDMTWDYYWYTNSFFFDSYLSIMNSRVKGLTIYHTIGNHDHDYKTSVSGTIDGWEAVDWDCAGRYRKKMGPNNYAFNIGSVHYIVLDNILCKNTTGKTTDDRFYDESMSSEAMSFLKEDLKYVKKDTPIVIASHSPYYAQTGAASIDNIGPFEALLSTYDNVRLVTGHSHKLWSISKGNIHEHNSGSVCAAWWWGGYYSPTLNIAQDGSLGGYRIMDVKGKTMESIYKTVGREYNYQFRSYDRNSIEITSGNFTPNASDSYKKTFDDYVAKYSDYGTVSTANEVIINIWDWENGWKLEVKENGKILPYSKFTGYDPLYFIAYSAKRSNNNKAISYNPFKTGHLFRVTASAPDTTLEITVTDDQGRESKETMKRPKPFSIDQYD